MSSRASFDSVGRSSMERSTKPLLSRCSAGYSSSRPDSVAELSGFIDIGCSSLTGNRYGGLQQDFMAIQELYAPGEIPPKGKQVYIATITDGHGIIGDKSSTFAGKAITRYLYSGSLRNKKLSAMPASELETEMKAAFAKGHQAAVSIYDTPPRSLKYPKTGGSKDVVEFKLQQTADGLVYRSDVKGASDKFLEGGCTATVAVVQGSTVCLANVGDSQAVLGCEESPGHYSGKIVTTRHWGFHAKEAERINSKHADCVRLLEDGYLQVYDGPWAGYELSVTRALGHKNMEQYGIMTEPDVLQLTVDRKHCCLIVASDGVWDAMSADEAVRHVMGSTAGGKSAQGAAQALVERCVELGLSSEHEEADNTSAIVVLFIMI